MKITNCDFYSHLMSGSASNQIARYSGYKAALLTSIWNNNHAAELYLAPHLLEYRVIQSIQMKKIQRLPEFSDKRNRPVVYGTGTNGHGPTIRNPKPKRLPWSHEPAKP